MHQIPLGSILSLQDLWKNQSLETVPICMVVQCFPHDNIAEMHICDEIKRAKRLSQPLVHLVTASASLTRVVEVFCSPAHNIAPHISLHDLL